MEYKGEMFWCDWELAAESIRGLQCSPYEVSQWGCGLRFQTGRELHVSCGRGGLAGLAGLAGSKHQRDTLVDEGAGWEREKGRRGGGRKG